MDVLSPNGPVYQAGTLSGNPVAMAAGIATLDQLERAGGWEQLDALSDELPRHLGPVLERHGGRLVNLGSIFWLSLATGGAPRAADEIQGAAVERYAPVFHRLLERGVALAPSAYEVGFLSTAHTEADIDRAIDVFTTSLREALA